VQQVQPEQRVLLDLLALRVRQDQLVLRVLRVLRVQRDQRVQQGRQVLMLRLK